MIAHSFIKFLIIVVISSMFFEHGLYFFVNYWKVTLNSIAMILLAIVMGPMVLFCKRKIILKSDIIVFFFAIIAYWICSLFNSIYSLSLYDAIFSVVKNYWYILFFSLFFLYSDRFSKKEMKKIINYSGFLSFVLLIFFMCYQIYTGELIRPAGYVGKFTLSPFLDYNMFVLMLCFSLIMIFFDLNENTFKIFLYFFLIFFIFLVAVFVGSRRSLLLYFPLMMFFSLSFIKPKTFLLVSCLASMFVLTVTLLLENVNFSRDPNAENVEERVERSLSAFDKDADTSGTRVVRWEAAIKIFGDSSLLDLIIGLGQRSFYAYPEYIRPNGEKDHPHNFFLTSIFEGGIVKASLIFIVLFFYIFLVIKQPSKKIYFFAVFGCLWIVTVSISGEEFFMSKQIYLIFSFLASYSLYLKKETLPCERL